MIATEDVLSFSRRSIIISFSPEREAPKTIDLSDRLNSFPGVLLPEIGANGVRAIIVDVVVDGGVDKVETRNTRFWLLL